MRIGCDLISLEHFRRPLDRARFRELVFHPREREDCEGKSDPLASLAARFAAKEAFVKALGTGFFRRGLTHQDVWLTGADRPELGLSARARGVMEELGLGSCDVSVSHAGGMAMATVLLY
jgi:holo-[acyl-carrier protein] synthase